MTTSVLLCTIVLTSCQSPEQKAAQAQKQEIEAAKAEKEQQIQALLDSTPDLYRVLWKVCGDKKVNLQKNLNGGCDESRDPVTDGYKEPLFMWGPIGNIQVEQKSDPILPTLVYANTFIQSRGCLASGTPKNEGFYKIREFLVDKNNPVSSSNITVERLSKEDKERRIRQQIGNVELTSAYTSRGLLPGADCPSLSDWKKSNQAS